MSTYDSWLDAPLHEQSKRDDRAEKLREEFARQDASTRARYYEYAIDALGPNLAAAIAIGADSVKCVLYDIERDAEARYVEEFIDEPVGDDI